MLNDDDLLHPPQSTQQKPTGFFKKPKLIKVSIVVFLIALVAGTGGYLLGARSKQLVFPPQPGTTITQSPAITTEQPTASLIPDEFINWKARISSRSGYAIKYPPGMALRDGQNIHFDFQLTSRDLLMTFVVRGIPESTPIVRYATQGFCSPNQDHAVEEKIHNVPIYRNQKYFNDNNICLDAVIGLPNFKLPGKWLVDIQGKAKNEDAVSRFDAIVSTFRLTD